MGFWGWNWDFITEIKIWKQKVWFKYWNCNLITEIKIWKQKFSFKHFNWDFENWKRVFLNWNCDSNIEIIIGSLRLGLTPLNFRTLKVREIYFQTQHGFSGYLIIKNFYFHYRIGGEQRTRFHQICQRRFQGQKKDSLCGYITPVLIGFLQLTWIKNTTSPSILLTQNYNLTSPFILIQPKRW